MYTQSPFKVSLLASFIYLISFCSVQAQCKITITAANTNLCSGSTTTITVEQAALHFFLSKNSNPYTWYKNGNEIIGQKSQTLTVTEAGDYKVRLNRPGCTPAQTESASLKITASSNPVANFSFSSLNLCVGSSIPVTNASTGDNLTYNWSVSPNTGYTLASGSLTSTNPTFIFSQSGNYTITLQAENSCNISTTTQTISIAAGITGNTISRSQSICSNTVPATLTGPEAVGGTGSFSYVWQTSTTSASAGFQEIPGATGKEYTPAALTGIAWFRRMAKSGECEVASNVVTITTNAPVVNGKSVCSGTMVALEVENLAGNYEWFSEATGGTVLHIGQTFNTPVLQATTSYYVQSQGLKGCLATRTRVEVTVTPVITSNTISANQAVCLNVRPQDLIGSDPSGGIGTYVYRWEQSTDNLTYIPASGTNNAKDYQPPMLSQTTWYRRSTASGSCESYSSPIQIIVNDLITNNTVSDNQTICIGTQPLPLQGTLPTGGNGNYGYRWEESTDNLYFSQAQGTYTEANYSPGPLTVDTWYRRVVTGGLCAESVSNAVKITINTPFTNNIISPTPTQKICAGTSPAVLTGSTPTGGIGTFTYLWEWSTTSPSTGFSAAPGTNDQVNYNSGKLSQTTWFRRKVRPLSCQENTSSAVMVTVVQQPAAPQAKGGITCPGGTAALSASSLITGNVFEWYSQEEGGSLLHTGPTFTSPQLLTTTDYFIQTVSQDGCASERIKATAVVTVPSADAGSDITILDGRSTQLQGTGGDRYSWHPVTSLSDPHVANPVANPIETTTYTLTVITKEGCVFEDEVTVTVLPKVKVANAITMDGNGINDTWQIDNIRHYPNCRVQIFTRWGAQIFDSKGYTVPWDGRHKGQPLPVAAYYYIIDLGMNEEPIAGSITIIK